MPNGVKDSTTTVKVVCAMLFLIFIICYVYYFQCDLLAMIQYAWSAGSKHYNRIVATVVVSVFAVILSVITMKIYELPSRFFTLSFCPTLLIVGIMTAVNEQGGVVTVSKLSLLLFLVLMVVSFALMRMASNLKAYIRPLRSTEFLSHPWWTNISILTVAFCCVYMLGNTDRTLHTRLAVERKCMQGDYAGALMTGFPMYDNDSSLVMLRALALSHEKGEDGNCQLGERLFNYDIKGSSKSLFPQSDRSVAFLLGNAYNLWQQIGFVPFDQRESPVTILKREIKRERQREQLYNDTTLTKEERETYAKPLCRPVAHDYLLCAYLLDWQLKTFISELPQYYKVDNNLPQHYREACVLYGTVSGEKVYQDAALEADYKDFLAIMRSTRDATQRNAALRDAYFGTYWYYYYCCTK